MLSLLGGAAMTSSGLAFSLDSWSGNIRQDETHPDTLTVLSTATELDSAADVLFSSQNCIFLTMLKCLNELRRIVCSGKLHNPCQGSAENIYE